MKTYNRVADFICAVIVICLAYLLDWVTVIGVFLGWSQCWKCQKWSRTVKSRKVPFGGYVNCTDEIVSCVDCWEEAVKSEMAKMYNALSEPTPEVERRRVR